MNWLAVAAILTVVAAFATYAATRPLSPDYICECGNEKDSAYLQWCEACHACPLDKLPPDAAEELRAEGRKKRRVAEERWRKR